MRKINEILVTILSETSEKGIIINRTNFESFEERIMKEQTRYPLSSDSQKNDLVVDFIKSDFFLVDTLDGFRPEGEEFDDPYKNISPEFKQNVREVLDLILIR